MKIFVILVAACCLKSVSTEYRYKVHGPPRSPPVQAFAKKWQHNSPRGPPPTRNRPIPVYMPNPYKIPIGGPKGPRPIAPPVRNFWKNAQNVHHHPPEKPFISSPTIKSHEFDYHLQTNHIPNHSNTIKQVGEKGPIHTIPAPNLSPADKPTVVEEVRQDVQHLVLQQNRPDFQLHQYQVTEHNEPYQNSPKSYKDHLAHYQDISLLKAQPPVHKADTAAVKSHIKHFSSQNTDDLAYHQKNLPNDILKYQQEQSGINPNELFQLLNVQPQESSHYIQAQQILGNEQQISNYQDIFNHGNLGIKTDPNYFADVHQLHPQAQIQIQPEYHSFNYQEQDLHQKSASNYDLQASADSSSGVHTVVVRNPNEALAQTQYVQEYFNAQEDRANGEPDAKASSDVDTSKSDLMSSAYYSTLPNKQAAEALASLQAAGKLNNNLMEITMRGSQKVEVQDQTPMTIYVPDDQADGQHDQNVNEMKSEASKKSDGEDYTQNVLTPEEEQFVEHSQSASEHLQSFGNRVSPKRT